MSHLLLVCLAIGDSMWALLERELGVPTSILSAAAHHPTHGSLTGTGAEHVTASDLRESLVRMHIKHLAQLQRLKTEQLIDMIQMPDSDPASAAAARSSSK